MEEQAEEKTEEQEEQAEEKTEEQEVEKKSEEEEPQGDKFKITCADCGKEDTVPFKPDGNRPVYCRDCFQKRRSQNR